MNYTPTATNTQITNTLINPTHPTPYIDGIKGMNIHTNNVEIKNTVDGIGLHGPNNHIKNTLIHELNYYPTGNYPGAQIPSHNDGIQVHGSHDMLIENNTIKNGHNAAIMITQDYTLTDNITIKNNYLDDGGCTINIHHKNKTPMSNILVNNNTFGPNRRNTNCAIIATRDSNTIANNNTYWNGTPAHVTNGGN